MSVQHIENRKEKLCDELYALYEKQQMCDFTVKVTYKGESHEVKCHQLVLVAGSEYFQQICATSDGGEGSEAEGGEGEGDETRRVVGIQDVNVDVVKKVITFMYQGACDVTEDNVRSVLSVATRWKILDLIKDCTCILSALASSRGGFIQYYNASVAHQTENSVRRFFRSYIEQGFEELQEENKIRMLTLEAFADLLTHQQQDDATLMFEAVLKWSSYNPGVPVAGLLSLVKYELMSNEYLLEYVLDHPLCASRSIKKRIKDIITENVNAVSNGKTSNVSKSASDLRLKRALSTSAFHPALRTAGIGRQLAKITKANVLKVMNFGNNGTWRDVARVPQWVDFYSKTCCFGSQIFILGSGFPSCLFKWFMIDIDNPQALLKLPDLPVAACAVELVHTGKAIYIIGGRLCQADKASANLQKPSDKVFYLDLTANTHSLKLQESTPLQETTTDHQCWHHKGHLYVMYSSKTPHEEQHASVVRVQRYNIQSSTWSEGSDSPPGLQLDFYACKGLKVNNIIMFISSPLKVMYNMDINKWFVESDALSSPVVKDAVTSVGNGTPSGAAYVRQLKTLVLDGRFTALRSDNTLMSYHEADKVWQNTAVDVSDCLNDAIFSI